MSGLRYFYREDNNPFIEIPQSFLLKNCSLVFSRTLSLLLIEENIIYPKQKILI